jgi:hypothetical protein
MKFTRPQLKRLNQALYFAQRWNLSCIDSYRIGHKVVKDGRVETLIPPEFQPETRKLERDIKAFDKLRLMIREELQRGKKDRA